MDAIKFINERNRMCKTYTPKRCEGCPANNYGKECVACISIDKIDEQKKANWQWFDEPVGNPVESKDREWGWKCSHCGYVLSDDFDDPDRMPAYRYCMNCRTPMFSGV